MWKCHDCGYIFDEPDKEKEYRGECWGTPAYETMYYCPRCGSEAFTEYSWSDDEKEDEE